MLAMAKGLRCFAYRLVYRWIYKWIKKSIGKGIIEFHSINHWKSTELLCSVHWLTVADSGCTRRRCPWRALCLPVRFSERALSRLRWTRKRDLNAILELSHLPISKHGRFFAVSDWSKRGVRRLSLSLSAEFEIALIWISDYNSLTAAVAEKRVSSGYKTWEI